MPTESLETILYRDLSKVASKDLIEVCSGLLRELVNHATNAYQRCADSSKEEENVDLAVLTLYLHIIEVIDGVEVLISQACATPAIPLVRSAFEALLALEYILERNYVKRSLSWLAIYAHNRIRSYELLEPATERGKQFQRMKLADNLAKDIVLDDLGGRARASISNLEVLLSLTLSICPWHE